MTPKEKAEYFVNHFTKKPELEYRQPKVDALILVNMLLKFGSKLEPPEYWQQVKEEINKM